MWERQVSSWARWLCLQTSKFSFQHPRGSWPFPVTPVQVVTMAPLTSAGIVCLWCTYIHVGKTPIHITWEKSKLKISCIWIATESNQLDSYLIWSWEEPSAAGTGGLHHTWFYTELQTEPWASCLLCKHSTVWAATLANQYIEEGTARGNPALIWLDSLESMACQCWLTLHLKGLGQRSGPIWTSTSRLYSLRMWTQTLACSLQLCWCCCGLTCHWTR